MFFLKRVRIAWRPPNSSLTFSTSESIQRSPCASLETFWSSGILPVFLLMGNLLVHLCFAYFFLWDIFQPYQNIWSCLRTVDKWITWKHYMVPVKFSNRDRRTDPRARNITKFI